MSSGQLAAVPADFIGRDPEARRRLGAALIALVGEKREEK